MFRHKKLVRNIPVSISGKNRRVKRELSNRSPKIGLEATIVSVQAERDLLIGILETLSQSRQMNEYLERLVEQIRSYSGCRCVGIRLLDGDGNIPYVSYAGFSREFYESESPLSVKADKCMCIDVIIYNGQLKRGDTIVFGTTAEPVSTKIRALLEPRPLDEIRATQDKFI